MKDNVFVNLTQPKTLQSEGGRVREPDVAEDDASKDVAEDDATPVPPPAQRGSARHRMDRHTHGQTACTAWTAACTAWTDRNQDRTREQQTWKTRARQASSRRRRSEEAAR